MKRRRRPGRKLLVASVGVAAVSYACGGDSSSDEGPKDAGTTYLDAVANLVAPDVVVPLDAVANLVPPPVDAGDDAASDAPEDVISPLDVVANLVAPDAGSD